MGLFKEIKVGETLFKLKVGDITKERTQVIVNAANSALVGGGGVDGAIHRAGGASIMKELREKYTECPPGDVVITGSGDLEKQGIKNIFHTVGPVWRGGSLGENIILASCYNNCLREAFYAEHPSISFPSISTGAYGYPIGEASKIALSSILVLLGNELRDVFTLVQIVLFSEEDFRVYRETAIKLLNTSKYKIT